MLSSEEKAHLHAFMTALTQRDVVATQLAEEELLYWCLSSKDALELLKKQKSDTSLSGRARYKISDMVAVATMHKRKMQLC